MGTGTEVRVNPLFDGINDAASEVLRAGTTTHLVMPGDTIVNQGEPGDKLYVLLEGDVTVVKGIRPVATLSGPNWFGELALLDNAPRSATVIAKTGCRLLTIPKDVLLDAVSKDPTLSLRMLRGYVNKLRADLTPPFWKTKIVKVIGLVFVLVATKFLAKHLPGDVAKHVAKALGEDFTNIITPALAALGLYAKRSDDKKANDAIGDKG